MILLRLAYLCLFEIAIGIIYANLPFHPRFLLLQSHTNLHLDNTLKIFGQINFDLLPLFSRFTATSDIDIDFCHEFLSHPIKLKILSFLFSL